MPDVNSQLLLMMGEFKGTLDGVAAKVDDIKSDQKAINDTVFKKLNGIEKTLSNTRVKIAGVAAGVSFVMVVAGAFLKKFIASGGQ